MLGEAWLATVVIRRKHHVDANACLELARLTHEVDGYPKYLPGDLDAFVNDAAEMAAWVAESAGRLVAESRGVRFVTLYYLSNRSMAT